jgi:hypothetical protein
MKAEFSQYFRINLPEYLQNNLFSGEKANMCNTINAVKANN